MQDRWLTRLTGSLVALLLVGSVAAAWTQTEQARLERLAGDFVAPCCWQESLAAHRSPTADEARAELKALMEQGLDDEAIRRSFVERYGARVLIVPEGAKADLLFWAPALFLALAAAAAVGFLWRLRRRAKLAPAAEGPLAEVDESEIDW